MSSKPKGASRRDFLKQGALGGLAAMFGESLLKISYAASRERITLLSSVGLDTLHPYAYTSGPHMAFGYT
jgi:anaerobic selenocysteine-containing dehydrogenase